MQQPPFTLQRPVVFGDLVFTAPPLAPNYLVEEDPYRTRIVQSALFWIIGHIVQKNSAKM